MQLLTREHETLTDYTQPTMTLEALARLLRQAAEPIVVLTHAKPDGDALGAVIALTGTLCNLGKDARGLLVGPVPRTLGNRPGMEWTRTFSAGQALPEAGLVVIVDTGAWSQLGPLKAYVHQRLDRTVIIDHHLSGDIDAAHRYVEGEAAATCEILAELIQLLQPAPCELPPGRRDGDAAGYTPLSPAIRDALFVGVASDTGWFRFANVRPRTHELAAKLIRQGADHALIYQELEQAERPQKLALMTRALNSLETLAEGRAALMVLRAGDFEASGALPEETERLIDVPQMVGRLRLFGVVSEGVDDQGRPVTRMSFRSRHTGDDSALNVAELAGHFGGGGHARAAGAKVAKPIEQVLDTLRPLIGRCAAGSQVGGIESARGIESAG